MKENYEKLISDLVNRGYLKTPDIINAFREVDRGDFVPGDIKSAAYLNQALPIGRNQTISQPLVVAFMLELLEPVAGEKILDIGLGSGWQAAILAQIVGRNGRIVALERIPELFEFAKKNLAKRKFVKKGLVRPFLCDGSLGFEKEAPFDKIVAAASARKIPRAWKEQLKVGGVIVAPVGESIIRLEKVGARKFEKKEFYGFSFVPLITGGVGELQLLIRPVPI